MPKRKLDEKRLINLTKQMFHECYSGKLDLWLSHFNNESIYLDSGHPILFGANAIKTNFNKFRGIDSGDIVHEEYYTTKISEAVCCVCGKIIIKKDKSLHSITTYFTILYRIVNDKAIILQQHNSYEYKKDELKAGPYSLKMNTGTFEFIQEILQHRTRHTKIEVKCGKQNAYIDAQTILYIRGMGKSCEYVCIDRIVSTNQTLKASLENLPDYFHQIHRSYIVNTQFITAIRRFEVELISGIVLPIPEKIYSKIKSDLKSKMFINSNNLII